MVRGRVRVYRDHNRRWWRIFTIYVRVCIEKTRDCRSIRIIRITPARLNHMHGCTLNRNFRLRGGAIMRVGSRCRYSNIEIRRRTRIRVHGYAHAASTFAVAPVLEGFPP